MSFGLDNMQITIGTKIITIPKYQEKKFFDEVYEWLIEHRINFEIENGDSVELLKSKDDKLIIHNKTKYRGIKIDYGKDKNNK